MKRVLLFAVTLVAASAALSSWAFAQSEPVPRDLALRLLNSYGNQNAKLYVGQIPPEEGRLEQLALPTGARVVGSTYSRDRQFVNTTVYLTVTGPAENALRFYDAQLARAGWDRQQGQGYEPGGFLPDDAAFPVVSGFCKGDVLLNVSAYAVRRVTYVDLGVYNANPSYSPCNPAQQEPGEPPVPPLRAPAESLTLDFEPAYGRYDGAGVSNIALESGLNPLELRSSYDTQLSEAGWESRADGQDGPLTWSQWTFRARGRAWSGLLTVLSEPAFPGRYLAQLLVVRR